MIDLEVRRAYVRGEENELTQWFDLLLSWLIIRDRFLPRPLMKVVGEYPFYTDSRP